MSELLSDLRASGLAMGARYAPTHFTDRKTKEDHTAVLYVGYTTDAAKADKAREAGAVVARCGGRLAAWEVSVWVIDP